MLAPGPAPDPNSDMIRLASNLYQYRELMLALAWKTLTVRYKQSYLGLAWSVLKPVFLLLVFMLVRAFVGIDTGDIPYPVLTFAALVPWILFQESITDATHSVVAYANLIKKIYFPREVFPFTAVLTKLAEFSVNLLVLFGLMAWFGIAPTPQWAWLPLLALYAVLAALSVALAGAALNVYYRDVGAALPVLMSLLMYASPIIYPLSLVRQKLLVERAAGDLSVVLYDLYLLNPLAGIIDAFQRVLLKGQPPDLQAMLPGLVIVAVLLPLSYAVFKRAEAHFADVV